MADKTFHLEVITPDRSAVDGDYQSVQLRAADGRMGILYNHAPLIGLLAVGRLFCQDARGKTSSLAVGDGFVEVLDNQVKVLVDFADFADEIDVKRAEAAEKRARDRLKQRKNPDVDNVRAEAALRRAIVRLKLGGRG
jgi:F-type H+-transporting ATPase subunit epsilon